MKTSTSRRWRATGSAAASDAGGVAPDDADPGAEPGETGGRGQPDPAGPAGDQHGLAGHGAHLSGRS